MLTVALSHLLGRGVRLQTHEAVALARELLAHPGGIPTPENIQLHSDGSASCVSTEGTPFVANFAELLQTLLPAGTPNVPAPLRYAIARGLGIVEAPPFGSLVAFSNALQRFEHGASRDVLIALLQRGAHPPASIPSAPTLVTPHAAAPPPLARPPAAVPPRPARVVPKPSASSGERPPEIAPAPLTSTSGGIDGEGWPMWSSRQWAWRAAAALVASFAVGVAVADRVTDRRAATKPTRLVDVLRGASATAPAANPARVELKEEIVRVPETAGVAQEIVAARRRADVAVGRPSGPVQSVAAPVSAIQAVRATNANAFSPAFASDGTAIFFHTGRARDARSAIEVAASQTGGGQRIMTIVDDGSHNYHAQPSPDGAFVAFDSDREGERAVYVVHRDGSQLRRVSGAGYAAVPTWSPDSQWLTYIRAEADNPSVWNLWIQPAAGGSARRVTNYRYGQTWAASWFPDNRRIAYSHEDALMVMDLPTGRTTRYRTPVKGQLVRTPAVSPDGTKIIFQVFHHGAWLLDLADGSMQRVLTDPTAEEFAWSPDGHWVAFHSLRDGQWRLYVLSRS